MNLLDRVVPATDDGDESNAEIFVRDLRRFGEPAKLALLRRAVGPHPGWRNLAGSILWQWNSWSPSDVPMLQQALRLESGGWVARPLGQIGTPEAIKALVEDLPNGGDNQTDFTLAHLGVQAIPYLFPLLEDAETAPPAALVIGKMKSLPDSVASGWVQMALGSRQPEAMRMAALRGIAAIGPPARDESAGLRALLTDENGRLNEQARVTLQAVRDSSVVMDVINTCHPSAGEFDAFPLDSFQCLQEIGSYGDAGQAAGERILAFLSSKNGAEREYATTVLGMIGYQAADSQIESELRSRDWRIVYAACRSLGWLGDKSALPEIDLVANSYWLPDVRKKATDVAAALRSTKGRVDRPAKFGDGRGGSEYFEIDTSILSRPPTCASNMWEWADKTFTIPAVKGEYRETRSLYFEDGELMGTDHGEWGGQLAWLPAKGQPEVLLRDNVAALSRTEGDAIALIGLSHMGLDYGYVIGLREKSSGGWNLVEVARLPATAIGLLELKGNLFAVKSLGRVVVFSPGEGILGLAGCKLH